jgi:hypothetical protein
MFLLVLLEVDSRGSKLGQPIAVRCSHRRL